jgi:ABC-type transport system involved in cytochrome c biogenesis permease subunit
LSAAAWLTMVANYAVHLRWRNAVFGFVFPPLAVGLLLSTLLARAEGVITPPALALGASAWQAGLITHVISILAGNLLFAMACLFSIAYLVQEHRLKAKLARLVMSRLPALSTLDRLNHRAIALGFFFLSVGILLGIAVSGAESMARWDIGARQIVPTLTWLVYAGFLLQRAFAGRRGRITAIWSIAGFVVVMTSLIVEIYILTARA